MEDPERIHVQFYLNGFWPGDPELPPVEKPRDDAAAGALPDEVDVLIVGCGPAGLVLAAQLSAFAGIETRIVERKPGPLELGQADGVACRSVEMFQAFGLAERLLREAYWVNETVFWSPDPADRTKIVRSGRILDTAPGLSEFPHVVMNQARIHEYLLESMRKSPRRLEPDYGVEVTGVEVDAEGDHPVRVTMVRTAPDGTTTHETVRARYVVGADGARSVVRRSIGRELHGDSANQAWGVMDVLARTDFPDIRYKATIQSANGGNIVVIPREGGYLVRLYVEMDKLEADARLAKETMTSEMLIEAANRILSPYTIEVDEIVWWSVYEIGQRLTDKFDDVPADEVGERIPRVFIAGDACHTHSPKAGQGMNVSMQDAFNLGWKLAAVLEGRSAPELLHTYSAERQVVAHQLIEFDKEWARMFSAPPKDPTREDDGGVDPGHFQRHFEEQGRYTAGVATHYRPSILTAAAPAADLARGFPVGERFHSASVVRLADGKPMELGHVAQADGRWRIYAFADAWAPRDPRSRLGRLCAFLTESEDSPLRRFTPEGADVDAVFDVRAVLQQGHRELDPQDLPGLLAPRKGRFGLVDYEKALCADVTAEEDVFDRRGIDRVDGCIVVVRPDQYVAHVLPLDAYEELTGFFSAFMVDVHSLADAR